MNTYKVSLISYLNSKPFLYGLENSPIRNEIEINLDIPSLTASKIVSDEADVGLIPVGALTDLKDYQIVSDYCIGAVGIVRTVVLASDSPLEEVDTILLDYQSRSSVLLTQVLAHYFWKRKFRWKNTSGDFEKKFISGKTAAVIIGDRVFEAEKKHKYIYDLASEWMKFSGLPFVFAVWVTCKQLPSRFIDLLNQAIAFGIDHVSEVEKTEKVHYPGVDIFEYLTENISYRLDDQKKIGMKYFLTLAREMKSLNG